MAESPSLVTLNVVTPSTDQPLCLRLYGEKNDIPLLPQNIVKYLPEKSQNAHLGECSVSFYMYV